MTDPETLVSWLLGELDADGAEAVRRSAESDPAVAAHADRLRSMLGALNTARSIDAQFEASPDRLESLRALAPRTHAPFWKSLAESASRVVASLAFDSRAAGPALAGFRGRDPSRRLIYETGSGLTIDLRIDSAVHEPDAVSLAGQVLGQSVSGQVFVSRQESAVAARAGVDEHGFFELTAPRGVSSLILVLANDTVVVPRIDLSL